MKTPMVSVLALAVAASGGPTGEPSKVKIPADARQAGGASKRALAAQSGVPTLASAERITLAEPVTRDQRAAHDERAQVATLYSVFPGYGMGHFLIGEHGAGMLFLALELVTTALWMAGPAAVAFAEDPGRTGAMGAAAPSATANAVFAIGLVAHAGLKVWEVSSARSLAQERPDRVAPELSGRSDAK